MSHSLERTSSNQEIIKGNRKCQGSFKNAAFVTRDKDLTFLPVSRPALNALSSLTTHTAPSCRSSPWTKAQAASALSSTASTSHCWRTTRVGRWIRCSKHHHSKQHTFTQSSLLDLKRSLTSSRHQIGYAPVDGGFPRPQKLRD